MTKTNKPSYGYHHLETDDECLARLERHRMSPKLDDETFDQWLERNRQARKLIYVP